MFPSFINFRIERAKRMIQNTNLNKTSIAKTIIFPMGGSSMSSEAKAKINKELKEIN